MIESTDPNHKKLVEKIQKEGVMRCKGYFYASLNDNGSLAIQVEHILPPEAW